MESPKHTPLPWGIERTENDIWIGPLRKCGDGKIETIVGHFCTEGYKDEYIQRQLADAELIVRSVNAKDDLVAVAEHYLDSLAIGGKTSGKTIEMIRAAIAKAEAANG